MQELGQAQNVRYLIENAGSMMDLHYHAFCELLDWLHSQKPVSFGAPLTMVAKEISFPCDTSVFTLCSDQSKHTGITRKRNFFRNNDDMQEIGRPHPPQFDEGGPLLTREGKAIILSPLLRTRNLLQFEVCWALWTL